MKTSTIFLGLALMFPVVASAQDDVYYIPSKDIRNVTTTDGEIITPQNTSDKAKYYEESRDVDDYNRRGSLVADSLDEYSDDTVQKTVESTFDDDNSSDVAYPYTKLVMRFHSPHPGYIVSSPYYWDICYSDVWDVYYDGWATYVPSYTYWSYTYDPWYYNRWHFRTCWDFTWGWYDRWYYRSYWGWGRPIYWGWSRPYYYHHHHYRRPMWGHGGYRRYAPGFGHHGGRTFAGRGYDAPRVGGFGGRAGSRAGVGAPRGGGRPLSGVFRSNRQPIAHSGSGQMSRGTRQTGPNSVMRSDAGSVRNGGGGITRSGRFTPGNNGQSSRQVQPQGRSGNSRSSVPSVNRRESRSTPSYTPSSSPRSSFPSSVGRSSSSRSSSPSSGGFGRSSSPSHSGGGVSRGGGGGVSRGGVSRGGRR